uniref:Uncharacterized protein n=1 Tax=Tanacetum cinerariifolium TaxID=118510 RepID=A0A6L2LTB3_TANCI|nr:hypothetical protein [Tanacetum cinerariifolium]
MSSNPAFEHSSQSHVRSLCSAEFIFKVSFCIPFRSYKKFTNLHEQVHKRPPTAVELFELTHTKNEAFITLKSERVAAAYNGALVDKFGSDSTKHPIYDVDLWKKCAEDDMKGEMLGWSSMSDPQYTELKEELKEEVKVDLEEEIKVELKEEMKANLKEEMKK